MANDLNQCNFIGRLGADPETRYAPDGTGYCSFRIAVGWKTKDKEGAEWVSIVTSGKLAEICGEYLKKGKQCMVSGRLVTRKWQDREGTDRYTTEIRADRVQLLGSREGGEGDHGGEGESRRPSGAQRSHGDRLQERRTGYSNHGSAPAPRPAPKPATGFDEMDDDIPFASSCASFDQASPIEKRMRRYGGDL